MTIPATYENGVFKPLEDVKLAEGTRVEVHVPAEIGPSRPKSVRDWPTFGMWADRDTYPMASRTKIASVGRAIEGAGPMAYLIDTNIVADAPRGSIAAADYLDKLAGAWSICTITCRELLAGTDAVVHVMGFGATQQN